LDLSILKVFFSKYYYHEISKKDYKQVTEKFKADVKNIEKEIIFFKSKLLCKEFWAHFTSKVFVMGISHNYQIGYSNTYAFFLIYFRGAL
jgi:hypothetical protein